MTQELGSRKAELVPLNVVGRELVPRSTAVAAALSQGAAQLIADSRPESTREAYGGDLARFLRWCIDTGLLSADLSPPVRSRLHTPDQAALVTRVTSTAFRAAAAAAGDSMPIVLANYVATLAAAGRAPSTIDRALAAILVAHETLALPRPGMKGAREALRGYRRTRAKDSQTAKPRKAAPVTITALQAMSATCGAARVAGIRDRAVLVLGFALGARRSEIAGLDIADLEFCDAGLVVTVRISKTDRDAVGREVAVPFGSNPLTCPVRTVTAWLDMLTQLDIMAGPLFRRVDRRGRVAGAPGLPAAGRGPTSGRLSGQGVARIVRTAALAAKLDPAKAWSGHSLRRGFATETYRRRNSDPKQIASHGGWKRLETMLGYVEEVDRWENNPLLGVGL